MARPIAFSFWGWVALGVTTSLITTGIITGINYAIEKSRSNGSGATVQLSDKIKVTSTGKAGGLSLGSRALARYYSS